MHVRNASSPLATNPSLPLSPSPFTLPTSCGRDQVLLLWDMEKARTVKTVPVFEVGPGGGRLCIVGLHNS